MKRRWFIRCLFMSLTLLCVAVWVGSYWWSVTLYCRFGLGMVVHGTIGWYWNSSSGYLLNVDRVLNGQASMFEVTGTHFAGFGWGREDVSKGLTGWAYSPIYLSFNSIPMWFPTTITSLLLLLVWRKTRLPLKGRAFPVEVAEAGRPSTTTTTSINVGDLNPGNVIGLLGKPLGTRIVIGGVKAERVLLANPLEISEIDGTKLDTPVSIEITGDIKIEKGVQYRLEGYESGAFEGSPDWFAPGAQAFIHFHSIFVVTKVIEPKTQ